MKNFKLLILSLLLIVPGTKAQDLGSAFKETFNAIKEVMIHGSIDDRELFLVYGLGDSYEEIKEIIKDDIINLNSYGEDMKDIVTDKNDSYSVIGSLTRPSGASKRLKKHFLKDITNGPKSFKENIELGQKAYRSSKSTLAGSVKFAGRAAWATLKGSYYLVIQAPTRAILNTSALVLVHPFRLGVSGLRLGFRTAKKVATSTILGSLVVLEGTYSIASSLTATGIVLITSAILNSGQIAKYVVYSLPRKTVYQKIQNKKLNLGYELLNEKTVMAKGMLERQYPNLDFEVKLTNKYKAKIIGKNSEGKKVLIHRFTTKTNMLEMNQEVKRSFKKTLNKNKKIASEIITKKFNSLEEAIK